MGGCGKILSSPGSFWASVARLFLKGGGLIDLRDGACSGDTHYCFSPYNCPGRTQLLRAKHHIKLLDCEDLNSLTNVPQTFILYCVQNRHKQDKFPPL